MSQSFKALTLLFVTVILALSSCSSDTDDAVPTVRNKAIPEAGGETACPPPKGEKWVGPVDKNGEPVCEAPVCPPPKGEKWVGPVDKNGEPICSEGTQEARLAPPGRFLPNGTNESLELPEFDPHATLCTPSPCVRGAVDWATSTAPDIVVVAFGDSYASGEGAPFGGHQAWGDADLQIDDPLWTAARAANIEPVYCHRSPLSTFARAMVSVHEYLPGVRLAWRNFACSGAVVENLIDVPQIIHEVTGFSNGQSGPWGVRPQLDSAGEWVESLEGGLTASVVYANIGGNDAGFSKAIKACVLSWQCDRHDDQAGTDERQEIIGYGRDARELVPTLLANLNTAIDNQEWFDGDFDAGRWSDGKIVYTVAPDIVHASDWVELGVVNRACGEDFDPANRMQSFPEDELSSAESQSLWTTIGVPLQESMRRQGASNDWIVVESDFSEHGICAWEPWIKNNVDAIDRQGADLGTWPDLSMGNWHPNDAGYDHWARDLEPALIEAVLDQLPADTTISNLLIDRSTVTFDYTIESRNDGGTNSYRERSMNVLTARATCVSGRGHQEYAYVFSPSDPDAAGETISIQPCGDELVARVILKQVNCFLDNHHYCGDPGRASGEQDVLRILSRDDGPMPGIGEDPDAGFEPDEDVDPFG